MLRFIPNYILAFFRQASRNKVFTILNLLGLSVGMAAFMLLLQFVVYENSFDEFHPDSDNIYRVRYDGYQNGQRMFACAAAVPAVGPAMKNNFPEVLEYSWAFPLSGVLTNDQDVSYREHKIQIATPSFLSMFSWEMLAGDTSALSKPYTVVVTESTARKYYGDEEPIGKTLRFGDEYEFEIRGVTLDLPENVHHRMHILVSWNTFGPGMHERIVSKDSENFWRPFAYHFILLGEQNTIGEVEGVFPEFYEKYMAEFGNFLQAKFTLILTPLPDLHFTPNYSYDWPKGNRTYSYLLIVAGLFILLIALLNFRNLLSASMAARTRSLGVFKINGASRNQLYLLLMTESLMIMLVSVALAWFFLSGVESYFKNWLDGGSFEFRISDRQFPPSCACNFSIIYHSLSAFCDLQNIPPAH